PEVVFELAGFGPFDRPVSRIVHAWGHLVRDESAAFDEELDGQHPRIVEMLHQAREMPLRLLLQRCVAVRRDGMAQDTRLVRVPRQRIKPRLSARAADADERDLAAEIYKSLVNQRNRTERSPCDLQVAPLAYEVLAAAVVAEPACLQYAWNVYLRGCPFEVLEARSEEHTSELQSREKLVCRLLLEKKKDTTRI